MAQTACQELRSRYAVFFVQDVGVGPGCATFQRVRGYRFRCSIASRIQGWLQGFRMA
jgi:hypothetical protein